MIAAVQGGCIGGGVDMATACCLRYATRDAFFVIQEINLGMMADVGTFNRMPKQLPEAVVRELGYTGDRLSAERAERLGFVNGLFDTHEQLVAGALEVARRIASKAPVGDRGHQADDLLHARPLGRRELRLPQRAAARDLRHRGNQALA